MVPACGRVSGSSTASVTLGVGVGVFVGLTSDVPMTRVKA